MAFALQLLEGQLHRPQRFEQGDETPVSTNNLTLAFWLAPDGANARQCLALLDEDPNLAATVRAIKNGVNEPVLSELVRKLVVGDHKQLVIRLGASFDLLAATNARDNCDTS